MILAVSLLVVFWQLGSEMSWGLYIVLYVALLQMAITVSVMVHNHQHLPMWKNRWLNLFTDSLLTVLYGFPIFAWIPTHNSNHHVHINKEPDYTKTYMVSEKNNLLTLLSYPSISGMIQQKAVFKYFIGLWKTNRKRFYHHLLQVVCLVVWTVGALVLDWRKGLLYVVLPQQLSLFTVMFFNYIQHVHADEESKYNSSRNMTGAIMNFLLINNGYHTAHHLSPATHWSKLKEKHEKINKYIHPSLNENNFAWYLFRVYILGIFSSSFRTKSMRLARLNDNPIVNEKELIPAGTE
jgi:fatty acid desaturase